MNPEEIKLETNNLYEKIAAANARLKELRTLCKHETTYEGLYSWRIGCIEPATICSDCGDLIKIHRPELKPIVTYTPIYEPKRRKKKEYKIECRSCGCVVVDGKCGCH